MMMAQHPDAMVRQIVDDASRQGCSRSPRHLAGSTACQRDITTGKQADSAVRRQHIVGIVCQPDIKLTCLRDDRLSKVDLEQW